MPVGKIQIGKNGLSDNFISTLKTQFKNHANVKISVLKSAREDKKQTKIYAEEILKKLGSNFSMRVIGHTIAVKRLRRGK
jgi:RNA-binding protein YhbY